MRSMLPTAGEAAIFPGSASGIGIVPHSESSNPAASAGCGTDNDRASPGSGSEDSWFYDCAIAVFGKNDCGQQLFLATGCPRTNCYAYVAKDPAQRRKPSPDFLRVLFRSDHGRPFFLAYMHGSTAPWFLDLQRNERLAAAAERFAREVG